jgi:hypothetical protein
MAIKHVQRDALNLRSEPRVADGNVIAVLVKGQAVDTLAASDTPGWLNVEATVDGRSRRGFATTRLLRAPASDAEGAADGRRGRRMDQVRQKHRSGA